MPTPDRQPGALERLINRRVARAMEPRPPHATVMKLQQPVYDLLNKFYFRLELFVGDGAPDHSPLSRCFGVDRITGQHQAHSPCLPDQSR